MIVFFLVVFEDITIPSARFFYYAGCRVSVGRIVRGNQSFYDLADCYFLSLNLEPNQALIRLKNTATVRKPDNKAWKSRLPEP